MKFSCKISFRSKCERMRIVKTTSKQVSKALERLQTSGSINYLTEIERYAILDYNNMPMELKRQYEKRLADERMSHPRNCRRRKRSASPITREMSRSRSRSPIDSYIQENVSLFESTDDHRSEGNIRHGRTPTPNDDDIQNYVDYLEPNQNDPQNNNTVSSTDSFTVATSSIPTWQLQKPSGMGTLENIGNSCYMNAVLYALRFTPSFLHNLHHLMVNVVSFCDDIGKLPSSDCHKSVATAMFISNLDRWHNESRINRETRKILYNLHKVFKSLTASEIKRDGAAFKADELREAVKDRFKPFTQQDAHEFLMFILNCLRDSSDSLINVIENHPDLFDGINDPASKLSFDYFRTNFMGERLSTTYCRCCETKRHRCEEMVDLCVPLPQDGKFDDNFIKNSCVTSERFEDSEKIKCEVCFREAESVQSITFPRLPRILIVHLGRFDNQMNKLNTEVPIPYRLKCFCSTCNEMHLRGARNGDHEYRLYGIIVHLGIRPTSGHYMAYVRSLQEGMNLQNDCESKSCCKLNLKPEKNEDMSHRWFICDDDTITKVQRAEFDAKMKGEATFKTPYILFYARNDLIAEK